jgi:murein L,D-transpeptidase YcbB/YkuD
MHNQNEIVSKNFKKYLFFGILFSSTLLILFAFMYKHFYINKSQINEQNVCLNTSKKYSNYKIDSNLLSSYLTLHNYPKSIQNDLRTYYERRDFQFAWFNQCGMVSAAKTFQRLVENHEIEFNEDLTGNNKLDSLLSVLSEDEKKNIGNLKLVSEIEILLTANFFIKAKKIYGGSVENISRLSWLIPRYRLDYGVLLDTMVYSKVFLEPLNPFYLPLKKKLIEYRLLEKSGLYPLSSYIGKSLIVGDTNSSIVTIKKQLFLVGDIKSFDTSSVYNPSIEPSIKLFQKRMGLKITGILDQSTIVQLNVPLSERIRQIALNLERLRWVPSVIPSDFLLVNIPEFKLHVFHQGKQIMDMNVIVGKAMHKTVIFEGKISSVVINPYWNIPSSIVKNEILTQIRRNPNYLKKNNIERVQKGIEINYRQKPGSNNALGRIKFLFPNHHNIYLHDAPTKKLFQANTRAFSHGCIRVEDAQKLALYILNRQEMWTSQDLEKIIKTNMEKPIIVNPQLQVVMVYFTTWVDHSGDIFFRKDIYGLDKQLEREMIEN